MTLTKTDEYTRIARQFDIRKSNEKTFIDISSSVTQPISPSRHSASYSTLHCVFQKNVPFIAKTHSVARWPSG